VNFGLEPTDNLKLSSAGSSAKAFGRTLGPARSEHLDVRKMVVSVRLKRQNFMAVEK
jgi:hypothetical protein